MPKKTPPPPDPFTREERRLYGIKRSPDALRELRPSLVNPLHQSPYIVPPHEERWKAKDIAPFVARLRPLVDTFRNLSYKAASQTSQSLLTHWFKTEHKDKNGHPFRYYFAQREALETLVYLMDVQSDEAHDINTRMKMLKPIKDGKYKMDPHESSSESWRRYVVKMATGIGKTKVLSLVIAWCYFHKLYEENSPLARNFLLLAPNIIVLDRLHKDFANLDIFHADPVLPPDGFKGKNWQKDFQEVKLHKQNDITVTQSHGNIFLSNIHRVYRHDVPDLSFQDKNVEPYFVGKKPNQDVNNPDTRLRDIARNIDELVVLNDEAHHIHDEKLAWYRSIKDIHDNLILKKNTTLSLQLDVTATPKDPQKCVFPQTITDYTLVEAIHQGLVKHPVLPDEASREKLKEYKSLNYSECYRDYIDLGIAEWRQTFLQHKENNKKAILFVMTANINACDDVAQYLEKTPELEGKVLTIHTKNNGDFHESELQELRELAKNIDSPNNKYRAVVSVMMLKEGWDVKNVTTIVGLRPYQAPSNILPEQTLGRGLRRMYTKDEPGRPLEEEVSVIGTDAFVEFVEDIKEQGDEFHYRPMRLEPETVSDEDMIIEIDRNKTKEQLQALDMELPVLTPRLQKNFDNVAHLNIDDIAFKPLNYETSINKGDPREIIFEYAIREEESHKTVLNAPTFSDAQQVIGFFTRMIAKKLRMTGMFSFLYPKVQDFVETKLFGKSIPLNRDTFFNLSQTTTTNTVIDSFVSCLHHLVTEKNEKPVEKEKTLSVVQDGKTFPSKKKEFLISKKNPYNKIIWDSGLERKFAKMLEKYEDVVSYAINYLAIGFFLDYQGYGGLICRYRPDFIVKLKDERIFVVELKGQEGIDARPKFDRLKQWCIDANNLSSSTPPRYHTIYLTKEDFELPRETTFSDLAEVHKNSKPVLPSQTKSADSQ